MTFAPEWMTGSPMNPQMGMPAPQQRRPGIMDRIGGLLGGGQSFGGLLSEDDQRAAQRQALLAMGAQMMQAGGPSPVPVSFGQALGQGLMAGQQAQGAAGQDMLQAMLLKTKLQGKDQADPAAVAEYKFAKENGFKGSFEEWKRVASAQQQAPSAIQEYEYFQKLDPERQKEFISLQRQPTVPQVVMIGNVPHLVDRLKNTATPLSTLDTEASSTGELARAKAVGTATGEAEGSLQKKGINAGSVLTSIEEANKLLDKATGSAPGAAADKVASFFGVSTEGDQANAQLKVIQANLMTNMPRMEGPQSDRDVQLYREAAGEIGDPTVPRERKKAALKMVEAINEKYAAGVSRTPKANERPPLSSFQK